MMIQCCNGHVATNVEIRLEANRSAKSLKPTQIEGNLSINPFYL